MFYFLVRLVKKNPTNIVRLVVEDVQATPLVDVLAVLAMDVAVADLDTELRSRPFGP
jgi:hypothetical protein